MVRKGLFVCFLNIGVKNAIVCGGIKARDCKLYLLLTGDSVWDYPCAVKRSALPNIDKSS